MRTSILAAMTAFAIAGCNGGPPGENTSAIEANAVEANAENLDMNAENVAMNADANMSDANPADSTTDTVGTPTYSGGDDDSDEVNSGDYENGH